MKAQPFCRPIAARELPAAGKHFSIVADADERARLAEDLGIPGIEELAGEFDVRPRAGGVIAVTGEVAAKVVQQCVVTLEPVRQRVRETVELMLVPAEGGVGFQRGGADAPQDEPESLDTFRYGRIDLGAIVAEHLALGLDPYPRKTGAEFAGHTEDAGPEASPFAALAALKRDE
jgi:uncharacterized protein